MALSGLKFLWDSIIIMFLALIIVTVWVLANCNYSCFMISLCALLDLLHHIVENSLFSINVLASQCRHVYT